MARETADQLMVKLEAVERRERDLGMENARLRRENKGLRQALGMNRNLRPVPYAGQAAAH